MTLFSISNEIHLPDLSFIEQDFFLSLPPEI